MRISTSMLYRLGGERILQQQSEMLRTQQQLSTGRRILTPSEDPIGATQVLRESQAKARVEQFVTNQSAARSALSLAEATLGDAGNAITDARTALVTAGNSTMSDSDRHSIALDLQAQYDRLLGLANTRDANGDYVFAGYRGTTQPFAATTTGAQYLGDEGVRSISIGDSRSIPLSVSGAWVFDRAPGGNGTFTIAPGSANAGTAVHDGGAVADPAAVNKHSYRVQFHVSGGVTTYDVVDVTASTNVVTGAAFSPDQAITFGGLQVRVTGAPADNDRFDIAPSTPTSLFKTLKDAIAALQAPANTPAARAALGNAVASGINALDQAHDRMLDARAIMGAHLKEIDTLGDLTATVSEQHAANLSRLQDLDYAVAITRFSAQQVALQAAQQSFLKVANLSIFDKI